MIKVNFGLNQNFHQNEQNTPILALEKWKNSPKITHNPTWRPNGGSDDKKSKKPNILQKISFPHSGLRFLIRPTVRPQFTKIGGSEQGPKKNFPKIFLAFSQYLGTPKTISLKTFQNFLTPSESKYTCVLMGHPSKY